MLVDKGLDLPIRYLKGVGPKKLLLLQKLGINTVKDAVYYFPIHYEDRRNKKKIYEISIGDFVSIEGVIVQINEIKTKRGLTIIEAIISDKTGFIRAKWFNQNYLKRILKERIKIKIFGKVQLDYTGTSYEILNPEFEILEFSETEQDRKIVPVYRLTEGLSQKQIQLVINSALEYSFNYIEDFMPDNLLQKLNLPNLYEAIYKIHFPPDDSDINLLNEKKTPYHKRIAFDELFLLQLGILMLKNERLKEKGISIKGDGNLIDKLIKNLPFKLTKAQNRVINEILNDMEKTVPMNRLLQGDVGSGKTVVALIAMLRAVESGYQSALMAPTEILAEQHYFNLLSLLKGLKINIVIHTSSYNKYTNLISSGVANIVVGTHALIQEDVQFKNLGLVIIDEQHRFGVLQRSILKKKGLNPHTLVMTATPIPRTLALTVYGDLDYSIIDELPAGRKPVLTKVVEPKDKKIVYKMIEEEINSGGQVYVVYPLIEESEILDLKSATQGYEALQKIFPNYKIGLLHGRIPPKQREEIMNEFRKGNIQILVATTVIEVGVDVPNATLMIITHAERFGLAQLHQLRGRVGRGQRLSKCILIPYKMTEEAKLRLKAMVNSNDGFKIAEEDLNIRGPGEFFGTKQSGMPDLKSANLIKDKALLQIAREEAEILLKKDPYLQSFSSLKIRLEEFWKNKIETFSVA
ncbi:ATP-dependent DNA helicase RecG [Thermodesulfovibrio sp. N1]|uniref:ATP-dependent DNA helicase RecG n=1 Tax=Thermodesulfovibrio sp. N1 TaxID=1871110 RepID=UPI00083A5DCE|nr:ATP-dependent DNA helicase RecG [Thermodesulfovibrio sp. N1]ODA44491.1 ATP-dependent DNA helicase RecG [Thermodesulfovibrio sp. N1]